MVKKDILLNGVIVGSHESSGDHEADIESVQNLLKEKGLHKVITTNDAMYGQANSFASVANEIYSKDLKKPLLKAVRYHLSLSMPHSASSYISKPFMMPTVTKLEAIIWQASIKACQN